MEDCAAWLMSRDVSHFNSKVPPPPTAAFFEMVEGGQSEDHGPVDDLIDGLTVFTVEDLAERASTVGDAEMAQWLKSGKMGRRIKKIILELGCVQIRNPTEEKGRWVMRGKKIRFYGRQNIPMDQLLSQVREKVAR